MWGWHAPRVSGNDFVFIFGWKELTEDSVRMFLTFGFATATVVRSFLTYCSQINCAYFRVVESFSVRISVALRLLNFAANMFVG